MTAATSDNDCRLGGIVGGGQKRGDGWVVDVGNVIHSRLHVCCLWPLVLASEPGALFGHSGVVVESAASHVELLSHSQIVARMIKCRRTPGL